MECALLEPEDGDFGPETVESGTDISRLAFVADQR